MPLRASSASLRSAPSHLGEGFRAADSRPYGSTRTYLNPWTGGSWTRPYGGQRDRHSFLQGPVPDRPAGGAHPRVASLGLRPIHLQPLPCSFQKTLPDFGRGGPWVSRRDSYQPSPARQNQAQPWNRTSRNFGTARAQWPGRKRKSPLRFCAPEILLHLSGTRPP